MDDQEPPKHSGPQKASKGIARFSARCYVIFSYKVNHIWGQSCRGHANTTSQPRASEPPECSVQPTEHPFSSTGPTLGSQVYHHVDMSH